MEHPKGRISAYLRHLERCGAPAALISDFLQLVEIDNQIASEPDGSLETLDRLLLDSCRKFNFAVPFNADSRRAHFRPSQLNSEHPDRRDDSAGFAGEFCPNEEQAYRRGYDQGFAEASRLTAPSKSLERRGADIHRWRYSRVWYGASPPGSAEPFGLRVSVRTGIPAKLRWAVLTRDKYRCVTCGAGPGDGVVLHVDHIDSLYNGGTNRIDNLQTLCAPCNLGKGKD